MHRPITLIRKLHFTCYENGNDAWWSLLYERRWREWLKMTDLRRQNKRISFGLLLTNLL